MGESWVEGGYVEIWEKLLSSVVHVVEEIIRWDWVTSVEPDEDGVLLSVTVVVDGIRIIISLSDVEVWSIVSLSEEDNIASTGVVALGIGVNSNSWGHDSKDWGLE